MTEAACARRDSLAVTLNPRILLEHAPRTDGGTDDTRPGDASDSRLRRFTRAHTLAARASLAIEGLTSDQARALDSSAANAGLITSREQSSGLLIAGSHADLFDWIDGLLTAELPTRDGARLLQETARNAGRRSFELHRGGTALALGNGTRVMAILNRTPDSFSDGGRFTALDEARAQADRLIDAGADILDIGGESTRPGADPVTADEECRRVLPIIEAVAARTDLPISIDTTKAEVARRAIDAGASIVNDVSGLADDGALGSVVARAGVPVVLMHRQGSPRTMQRQPAYDDVIADICRELRRSIGRAEAAGIDREQIIVDPGIGFGKTVAHNLEIFRALPELRSLGRPVLVGASRKRFLGSITGADIDDRLAATLATVAACAAAGVEIVRVHDPAEARQVIRVIEAIRAGGASDSGSSTPPGEEATR